MSALETFVFKQFTTKLNFEVEKEALEGMKRTLKTLEVHKHIFGTESIRKLVGEDAANLPELLTLDLSYNTITRLPKLSFSSTRNVLQIYLRENEIEYIELGAFEGLIRLRQIFLNDNRLKTLPDNLFLDIDQSVGNQSIYVNGNPWVCNCSLLWLSNYMQTGKINRILPPECNGGPLFVEESSCRTQEQNNSVVSNIINVTCERFANSDPSTDYADAVILYLKSSNLKLSFEEKEDLVVVVSYDGTLESSHLFWYNSENYSERWCLEEIKNNTSIDISRPATTYVFCFIPTNESLNQLKVCEPLLRKL